ncbi:MAG: DUF1266 domain-containing protein [Tannerellaceae bacterium]|jgi:hypothetical protein|nr:DUF1266 domain-containing protein [Tannerellaceae bacterium]
MKKILSVVMLGIALSVAAPGDLPAQSATERIEKVKREQAESRARMQAQQDSLKARNERLQAEYDAQSRRSHGFLWLFIVVGAGVGGVFYFIKYRSTIMSILRIFTGGFRVKGDIHTLESKKILTGAIYSFQQGAYINTLRADVDDKVHIILGDWWSIRDRESAIDTLDYLRDKGFAYYFPTVWKASQAGSDEAIKAIIVEEMTTQEDAEKAYSQTCNLIESIDKIKELKIVKHTDEIGKLGVDSWDAGRLIFIARLCYDVRFITEDEAWQYIDAAYAKAQRSFNSWEEVAHSYIIGRFVWNGVNSNDGVASLAEDLLNKSNSPWRQVAWK